jgi:hypothetical protein
MEECIIYSQNDNQLKNFYKLYSSIFTLPEEKETLRGFEQVLKLNKSKNLIKKYGFFKEQIIYLKDGDRIIAAIDFAVYSMNKDIAKNFKTDATCHIIYLFVDKEYRMHGLGKRLLILAKKEAMKLISSNRIYFFIDEKVPSKMSKREREEDEEDSGIKERKRIFWWKEHGFKKLSFEYIQPPLNKNKKADTELSLNIKTKKKSIPSEIIIEHLYKFFSISVLKGKAVDKNKYFLEQREKLNKKLIKTI